MRNPDKHGSRPNNSKVASKRKAAKQLVNEVSEFFFQDSASSIISKLAILHQNYLVSVNPIGDQAQEFAFFQANIGQFLSKIERLVLIEKGGEL